METTKRMKKFLSEMILSFKNYFFGNSLDYFSTLYKVCAAYETSLIMQI